jgi:hypothetical protein
MKKAILLVVLGTGAVLGFGSGVHSWRHHMNECEFGWGKRHASRGVCHGPEEGSAACSGVATQVSP